MKKRHINTGCLYSKDGQEITIMDDPDLELTHFIDHSRGISGFIMGIDLSIADVIKAYLRNDYSWCKLNQNTQTLIDNDHENNDLTFIDWKSQYNQMGSCL